MEVCRLRIQPEAIYISLIINYVSIVLKKAVRPILAVAKNMIIPTRTVFFLPFIYPPPSPPLLSVINHLRLLKAVGLHLLIDDIKLLHPSLNVLASIKISS